MLYYEIFLETYKGLGLVGLRSARPFESGWDSYLTSSRVHAFPGWDWLCRKRKGRGHGDHQ